MQKRKRGLFFYSAIFQIVLLISASFAFSFLMSGVEIVSAQTEVSDSFVGPPDPSSSGLTIPTTQPASLGKAAADSWEETSRQLLSGTGGSEGPVAGGAGGGAVPPPPPQTTSAFLGGLFKGSAFGIKSVGGVISALSSGLIWGAIVYGGLLLIGNLLGLDDKNTKALALSGFLGTFTGTSLYFLANNGLLGTTLGAHAAMLGILTGVGIGVAVFLATYKKEKKELVRFECLPWEAPSGGANCEECNKDLSRPCSEYRCKSLGQACELLNKGTTEEVCAWVGKDDVTSPVIEPWDDALKPVEMKLRYVPDNAIRPPNRGVKISRLGASQGCLQAYTKLEFGVTTNEPAQCRIDYEIKKGYDDMTFLFGETNAFLYNHTQRLKVPDPFNEEGDAVPEIHNDGTYNMYARCKDANGNWNVDAFVFRFCVEKGPDTKQPRIERSSIPSGSPVQFNADRVPIEVYVDEPSECRWSMLDKAFDDMENTMNCATQSYQVNSELNYVCSGELKGIKNLEDNNFFFRCKDRPGKPEKDRNVMTTSFPLVLRGTQQLTITKSGPKGTIKGGTRDVPITLEVETALGANEGAATCKFSNENVTGSFLDMDVTGGFSHNQTLSLEGGGYVYYIQCIDAGGNVAYTDVAFNVLVDREAPRVSRVYRDNDKLAVITDEPAKCSYSLTSCNYNLAEGVAFVYADPTKRDIHLVDWKQDVSYYVRCADLQNNQPRSGTCSVVARGSEF